MSGARQVAVTRRRTKTTLPALIAIGLLAAGFAAPDGASATPIAAASTIRAATAPARASGSAVWRIGAAAGGIGGPAPARQMYVNPCAVTYAAGQVQLIDGDAFRGAVLRQISQRTGALTNVAGTGTEGISPSGTLASAAQLSGSSCAVAVDHSGNVLYSDSGYFFYRGGYISNTYSSVVRVVAARAGRFYGQDMRAGRDYTIAGDGQPGFSGDGGPAVDARLEAPGGLAVDSSGNVVVADVGNDRVRVIAATSGRFYQQQMTAGDIYTVAGNGQTTDSGDGGPATAAGIGLMPTGDSQSSNSDATQLLRIDHDGNIVIAEADANRVRVVAVSTGRFYGQAMTAGHIYTIAGTGTSGFSGDRGPATAAELSQPDGIAVDHAGNIVVADFGNGRARVIAVTAGRFYGQAMKAGDIYTVAGGGRTRFVGNDVPATKANLAGPQGVAVDGAGNLVLADAGEVQVVALHRARYYGELMRAGYIYVITNPDQNGYSGAGKPATQAQLNVAGLASDRAGDLMIQDGFGRPFRVELVAARRARLFGQAMRKGDIYTIASRLGSLTDDNVVSQIAADSHGNLLVSTANQVDVVAARTGRFYGRAMRAGSRYVIAGNGRQGDSGLGGLATRASLYFPGGLGVDSAGNVLITEDAERGFAHVLLLAVRSGRFYGRAMKAGHLYSIAGNGSLEESGDGGPATSAGVAPQAVAVDRNGNVLVADEVNTTIRLVAVKSGTFYGQVMKAGDIYTVAGSREAIGQYGGDGGPAVDAGTSATDVALDPSGDVVIADGWNNRIRLVAIASGTFYGQPMKAQDIYTIGGDGDGDGEGNGNGHNFGNGIPAIDAALLNPDTIAVAPSGALFVSDEFRVRVISP